MDSAGAQLILAQAAPDAIVQFVPFALILGVFYFLLIRPQQQKAKEHEEYLKGLKRGELVVTQPPVVMLNGEADRLAPGARIRGQDNLIVLSGRLAGAKLVVNYTRELSGQLHDVWILTPAERARLWPKTPQETAAWRFDRLSQTWKK